MVNTPATSVPSSPSKLNGVKHENEEVKPSDPLVTEEMVNEESALHESSEQKILDENSEQVIGSWRD
jgi:hypothetical protein